MVMMNFFSRLFPAYDWIQVEISTYCNAACVYCPHGVYKENWQNRYLPLKSFQNLVPEFTKTRHIHLQGWGEPFCSQDIFAMLRLAKDAGCQVSTTTNGMLLNQETIEFLVHEGLDIIAFSLAGVDDKRNDSVRRGTRLKTVLKAIEKINRVKAKCGTERPKIHIAYMLLRSGLNDLEKLPSFLGNIGASQAVISSLSLVVSSELETESILASDEAEFLELKQRMSDLQGIAASQGVDIHFHIVSPFLKNGTCSENIERSLVIGSEGNVSPCVMTKVPTRDEAFYFFKGERRQIPKVAFGNIMETSVKDIWHQKDYREFRSTFARGKIRNYCAACLKRFVDTV